MDNVTTPAKIREYIQKSSFYFKKNLGQNFLKDEDTARRITDLAEASPGDAVLEVGPGFGSLTQFLLAGASEVYAVEIDPFAVKALNDIFAGEDNLKLINTDILKADLPVIMSESIAVGRTLKAVSNLPYYITSPIIMKLLTDSPRFERVVVMVQKEMAARLSASPGEKDYSAFTVAVNYFAETKRCFDVSRNMFMPSPAVDSTVLLILPREKPLIEVSDEKMFLKTVRAAFAMRRKTMLNCMAAGFGLPKEKAASLIKAAGIDPQIRGEELNIGQFGHLSDVLKAEI